MVASLTVSSDLLTKAIVNHRTHSNVITIKGKIEVKH